MNLITFTRGIQPQVLPQTFTRINSRWIQPQIQPQAVPRPDNEELILTVPGSWRIKREPKETIAISPTGEAKIWAHGFRSFNTLSDFESWLFPRVHFDYQQVGSALMQIPVREIGMERRFAVNSLDIVIREYECGNKPDYTALAAVRIRNAFVMVVLNGGWNARAEYGKVHEASVKSLRFVSNKLI